MVQSELEFAGICVTSRALAEYGFLVSIPETTWGLSQNPGLFQGDVGELEMDEGQIIVGFLFPTHKQAPCAVRPGVASFHYPATGALSRMAFGLEFALAGDVRNVAEAGIVKHLSSVRPL